GDVLTGAAPLAARAPGCGRDRPPPGIGQIIYFRQEDSSAARARTWNTGSKDPGVADYTTADRDDRVVGQRSAFHPCRGERPCDPARSHRPELTPGGAVRTGLPTVAPGIRGTRRASHNFIPVVFTYGPVSYGDVGVGSTPYDPRYEVPPWQHPCSTALSPSHRDTTPDQNHSPKAANPSAS